MGYQMAKPPCLECGKPSYSRRLCKIHYYRARSAGRLSEYPEITATEAFMSRIMKTDKCWIWTAGKSAAGYGMLVINYKRTYAHRYAFELFRGPIPDGAVLMHSCDNPACVNPWHLTPGSQLENMKDAVSKRRVRHGEGHHAAKLTTEQVEAIRVDTRPQRVIAAEYGVQQQCISKIKLGLRRRIS